MFLLISVFLSLLSCATCFTVTGQISPSLHFSSTSILPSDTHFILSPLSGDDSIAFPTYEGKFTFYNISAGDYVFSVDCRTHSFSRKKLHIDGDKEMDIKATGQIEYLQVNYFLPYSPCHTHPYIYIHLIS